jgi:hypothetical protein
VAEATEDTLRLASELLAVPPGQVVELGAGETFTCFGAGDVALLLPRHATAVAPALALGKLRLARACADLARPLGVRTPAVLEVGSAPVPHALCERVRARPVDDTATHRLSLYEDLGRQLARLHGADVGGAGPLVAVGGRGRVEGPATSWSAYCDDFAARVVDAEAADPRVARLRAMGDLDAAQWDALAAAIRDHGRNGGRAVLCHYDNRLPNLPVDAAGVWLLDWDLARAAPLSHELIKLFERPHAAAVPDARALLGGYGLPTERHGDVIADAQVALAMDGIGMSLGWIDQPSRHDAIRRWLAGIGHIVGQL